MRFISEYLIVVRKWPLLTAMSCILSGCFTGVGGLRAPPTKYDGIWRFVVASPDCIDFELETKISGGGFTLPTIELPPISRRKIGRIGGHISSYRVSTPASVRILSDASKARIPSNFEIPDKIYVAEVEMAFSDRRNGSGTFRSPECSGTITAQRLR